MNGANRPVLPVTVLPETSSGQSASALRQTTGPTGSAGRVTRVVLASIGISHPSATTCHAHNAPESLPTDSPGTGSIRVCATVYSIRYVCTVPAG